MSYGPAPLKGVIISADSTRSAILAGSRSAWLIRNLRVDPARAPPASMAPASMAKASANPTLALLRSRSTIAMALLVARCAKRFDCRPMMRYAFSPFFLASRSGQGPVSDLRSEMNISNQKFLQKFARRLAETSRTSREGELRAARAAKRVARGVRAAVRRRSASPRGSRGRGGRPGLPKSLFPFLGGVSFRGLETCIP